MFGEEFFYSFLFLGKVLFLEKCFSIVFFFFWLRCCVWRSVFLFFFFLATVLFLEKGFSIVFFFLRWG